MRQKYYYFVSSLPSLEFGAPPPFPLEKFLEECQRQMSPKDAEWIQNAVLGKSPSKALKNPLVRLWIRFNEDFRNELAFARALKAKRDPLSYLQGERSYEPFLANVVAQAIGTDDPLAAEKILDRFRWQRLDDLTFDHYFDVEWLLIYALKLQILERYQMIESHRGEGLLAEYKEFEMPVF